MNVTCGSCGVNLQAKDELAGKTAKCPKCGNAIEIPKPTPPAAKAKIPPATERQKEYATSLGIKFPRDINRKDLSELIDAAAQQRDEERFKRLNELSDHESAAWQKMREEVLAEIDEEDCRLSKAEPAQMLEELANRNRGAILISFDWDDAIDFEDLTGAKFGIEFSDDMAESDMRSVLMSLGAAMLRQSHTDAGPEPVAAPPPTPDPQPYDLKGDHLGMHLNEFKRKHHRVIQGHNETAPWCSDTRPGEEMESLLSKTYYAEAGLINCRLDFPFERIQGNPPPTVAGVETQLLIYEFVDQQLFRIIALYSNDDFDTVCEALLAKYGTPTQEEDAKFFLWSNGVSTIAFKKGRLKRDQATLFFIHDQLADLAESRRPGPAVHDL